MSLKLFGQCSNPPEELDPDDSVCLPVYVCQGHWEGVVADRRKSQKSFEKTDNSAIYKLKNFCLVCPSMHTGTLSLTTKEYFLCCDIKIH